MIDSVVNLVFRCAHKRLSRPVTPASRPGEPAQETYVVCLECGKHFAYDTRLMRLGKAVTPPVAAIEPSYPVIPGQRRSRLKYLIWAALIPIGFIVGAIVRNSRGRSGR